MVRPTPSSPPRPCHSTKVTQLRSDVTGLYGFNVHRLRTHYCSSFLSILCKIVGAEVVVTTVPATGSIALNADQLDWFLLVKAPWHRINLGTSRLLPSGHSSHAGQVHPAVADPIMTPHHGKPLYGLVQQRACEFVSCYCKFPVPPICHLVNQFTFFDSPLVTLQDLAVCYYCILASVFVFHVVDYTLTRPIFHSAVFPLPGLPNLTPIATFLGLLGRTYRYT